MPPWKWVLIVIGSTLSATSCAVLLAACAGAGYDPRAVEYGAELNSCVDRATSRPQAEACIDGVKRRYGRTDGGAR